MAVITAFNKHPAKVLVSAAPAPAAQMMLLGVRIYGVHELANAQDAPWTAGDAAPNAWDYFEGINGAPASSSALGGLSRASSIQYGSSTTYTASVEQLARNRGAFTQWDFGQNVNTNQQALDLRAQSGDSAAISAGGVAANARSLWQGIFTAMKNSGHPVLFRPWWEMNASFFAWGGASASAGGVDTTTGLGTTQTARAANYVTCWRTIHALARDVFTGNGTAGSGTGAAAGTANDTGNCTFFWCPNDIRAQADPTPWYPGDNYVDMLGWDFYAFANRPYESPSTINDAIYAKLVALDGTGTKPFGVGEWGVCTIPSPGDLAFMDDLFNNWLPGKRVKYMNYFNDNRSNLAQYSGLYIENSLAKAQKYATWAQKTGAGAIAATYADNQSIPFNF